MNPFLVYILKVALLTAVFVLLYHLLLRRDTFHRTARIVLVSSLVISYILPFCVITIHKPAPVVEEHEVAAIQTPVAVPAAPSRYTVQPEIQQEQRLIQQEQNQIEEHVRIQARPQHEVQQAVVLPDSNQSLLIPARKHIDWILVSIIIYALGVVCLIILRLLSALKVMGVINRGRTIEKKDGYSIVISSDNIRPFSWMNSIVLPEDMAQSEFLWNSAVVRHEHSHVSHHHSIELLAIDILSAFQWFNPAVWLLRHDLCCVQEFQADASVLDSGLDKLEYEKSLLSIATGGLSIPLVNGLGESYLRTRIKMMNRNLSSKGNLYKLIYLPVVLVLALGLMSNTVYDAIGTEETGDEYDDYPEHEFVDLGLSVNWATLNIGANYIYYRGDFFDWNTESQNDTATVLWGEKWRMPTKEEFQELMDKCQWEWDKENQGYKVIGKNGNSIFLPAGGFKSGDRDYLNYGSAVYLWGSRDLESLEEPRAWVLSVVSGPNSRKRLDSAPLSLQVSHSIRPVTEQPFIPIQDFGLKKNGITLEIGQEYKLKASFIPSDATRKRIFWYSGNSAVAKVDAHGKVTAVSNGECTIKAVCGDFKVECQVTVKNPKGYIPPKQVDAVTIFRFGDEVNKEFIDSLQDDYDDSMLETEEVFKTRIGDASGGITVTLFNYTDKDWNSDPGDFRIIDIDVAGRHYRFRNVDWVREDMFDNGYFHCCQISDSRYLLFLKGFDYGCCPGTLTVFAIDETGVYPVMNKEYHLREFNREPFSMTVADWYDEYVSDDVTINSATYTLFIEDGALKKRWVQLFPNKHEYVDLGLSVNWATCNVGAEKPEEYGDYYAWGETAPYYVKNAGTDNELQWRKGKEAGYDWKSYFDIKTITPTDYDDIVTFLYYNTLEKKVIEYYHDAATTNWGGEWRMPRQAEFEELINPDNCTWTWTTMNGVKGYRVTSRKPGYEGNSIFLPAAGGYSGTDTWLQDAYGWYWSGSIDDKSSDNSTNFAYILSFYSDTRFVYVNSAGRCSGHPVRPVLPNGRNQNEVFDTNNEPVADNTEIEPETAQTMLARFDGSFLESQVALQSYQDSKIMSQSLPEIMLDSLKKQYPELNSIESIYDDGILTNDKPYKGYISCIQLSKGVYSFWVMGLEDKGGQVVSIELGSIDDAIAFLKNLVSSFKQGNTVHAQGHTLTGVRGNAYSVPRTDGVEPGPYLISIKNLKHDLTVLEKRKNWGTANFDEIAFFTMDNKPDHYEVLNPRSPTTYEYLETNTWEGVDGGEEWARTELEKQIREHGGEGHVPGKTEWARSRFNGVILLPLQKNEFMKQSGAYREYVQFYIPIIYDSEKYQAPLTDYQRSLKRSVFRRDSKKDKTGKDAFYNEVGFFTMENKPDEYEVISPYLEPAEMTLNEREDGGSGESWAATEIEKRIRDLASRGIRKDVANTRFNGVILLGELTRGYNEVFGTWYRQYFIPINYDQKKYQAPLTEYQKGLKQRKK